MATLLDKPIEPEEIVDFLKKNIQLKEICQQILHQRIIQHEVEQRNLTLIPEEIQAEGESQRLSRRLEKASDTLAWLAEQMIAPDDWEAGICDRLLAKKLAESLFGREVEKLFAVSRLNFDRVLLYQIIVPYEKLAWELFYQIEEEEMSFYQAAHLYDIDEHRRYQCGYEGKLYRWNLKPEIAAVIFSARPGQLVTPVKTELGYHLFLVEEFIPAQLTPEIHQELLNNMFNEWLASETNYLLHNTPEVVYV